MDTVLLILSILLITLVVLQSSKAEGASQVIQGGNLDLFSNRKERGSELFMTRLTLILGVSFFVTCLIMSLQ
jgi:preprotein translocase subunit SecG